MTAPAVAPPSLCSSFIGARMMRATLVDTCGRPVWGPRSQVVTKGFVSVEIAPSVEEGEDYKVKNANGDLCVNDKGQDTVSWYDLTIEFCQVDPDLFLMMQRTWKRVTDALRQTTTGWRQGETLSANLGYALELWPKASGSGSAAACLLGDDEFVDPTIDPGGYFLLPWVLALAPESLTVENSPTSFKQKGRTRGGSLWGHGPYEVTRDAAGLPAALLDPIDPGFNVPAWDFVTSNDPDHFHAEIVTVTPPAPMCGAQPLWNPDATAAVIAAVPDGVDTMTVDFTVTNFAAVGQSGVVDWGDGLRTQLNQASAGAASHTYAAPLAGEEQTISFSPGNGAEPTIALFTPEE